MSSPPLHNNLIAFLSSLKMEGELSHLRRISVGANKEVWRFNLNSKGVETSYVLRRNLTEQGNQDLSPKLRGISIEAEAELLEDLADTDLRVPTIVAKFDQTSNLGRGFLMRFEQGESEPSRVLGLEELANARSRLADDCGYQLATLHGLRVSDLAVTLPDLTIEQRLDRIEETSRALENKSPVHALARRWLRENIPMTTRRCIRHGDFRLGNLLVEESGLVSILDWEMAMVSHPEEDLGYLTANINRFNRPECPVGGFGSYEQLFDAYERTAGWRPDLSCVKYWQLITAITWGAVCLSMQHMFTTGQDRSLRALALGRRFSESEVDILLLLDELA